MGLGIVCRLDANDSTGFALAHAKQVLHMSLFARAAENSRQSPGSRMIRFSDRIRRRFQIPATKKFPAHTCAFMPGSVFILN